MYTNGEGVIQNNVIAHMLYNLAGAQGNENGRKNRDLMSKRMTPSEIAKAQDKENWRRDRDSNPGNSYKVHGLAIRSITTLAPLRSI
jgi:hypothetical protein|tara:strand:- start:101 stop:361 length:261 start_codon:yes stop_codon:yes gene_type:complete